MQGPFAWWHRYAYRNRNCEHSYTTQVTVQLFYFPTRLRLNTNISRSTDIGCSIRNPHAGVFRGINPKQGCYAYHYRSRSSSSRWCCCNGTSCRVPRWILPGCCRCFPVQTIILRTNRVTCVRNSWHETYTRATHNQTVPFRKATNCARTVPTPVRRQPTQ